MMNISNLFMALGQFGLRGCVLALILSVFYPQSSVSQIDSRDFAKFEGSVATDDRDKQRHVLDPDKILKTSKDDTGKQIQLLDPDRKEKTFEDGLKEGLKKLTKGASGIAVALILMKIAKELERGTVGIALALTGIASEVVKGETGVFEAPARLSDESVFSAETTSSDTVKYTIDDILKELKTSVQELDPETRFSEERQMLHNRLRTLYTDVQVDTGLSDEEKERHLKTIAEIQDIVQPSSPPRNPPRRRNRARSQPAQGLQGSLDSGDVKQENTDNLRQEQPIRGIASTGMCVTSDTKTISHQCLQQCACLLVQSNPATPDANQKSVNQEVQP